MAILILICVSSLINRLELAARSGKNKTQQASDILTFQLVFVCRQRGVGVKFVRVESNEFERIPSIGSSDRTDSSRVL